MVIGGLIKMTLLDYPQHVACSVFLKGCNFRCPFCYNSSLIEVEDSSSCLSEDDLFAFLKTRVNKLDGVAISGGEPLLQPGIVDFIKKIKNMGFKVKLDTNGTSPEILKHLIKEKLIDYVAMDIKNCIEKYPLTTGCALDINNILQSIEILLSGEVDYEFRTTVVKELHDIEDFKKIGLMIQGASKYYLQSFLAKESVLDQSLHAYSKEELQECINAVKDYVKSAQLRGV